MKKVIIKAIDLNKKPVAVFNTIEEAVEAGHSKIAIQKCLDGSQYTHHGLIWSEFTMNVEAPAPLVPKKEKKPYISKVRTKHLVGKGFLKLYRIDPKTVNGNILKIFVTLSSDGEVVIDTSLGDRGHLLGKGQLFDENSEETKWSGKIILDKINTEYMTEAGEIKMLIDFSWYEGDIIPSFRMSQSIPKKGLTPYVDTNIGYGSCRTTKIDQIRNLISNAKQFAKSNNCV